MMRKKEVSGVEISDVRSELDRLIKVISILDFTIATEFMRLLEDNKIKIKKNESGVAYTDGKEVVFLKDFFKRDLKEQVFILLHEILHIKLEHFMRFINNVKGDVIYKGMRIRKEQFLKIINISTDLAINSSLKGLYEKSDNVKNYSKLIKPPKDALYPENFNLEKEKSSDFYLKEILEKGIIKFIELSNFDIHNFSANDNKTNNNNNNSDDNNDNNEVIVIENDSDWNKIFENPDNKESENNRNNKKAGKSDNLIERLINQIIGSNTLRWASILKNDLFSFTKSHPNKITKKIDKKNLSRNVIMLGYPTIIPFKQSLKEDFTINVNVFIDTSGSIRDKELQEFLYQIYEIVKQVKYIEKINVYLFADEIYYTYEIKILNKNIENIKKEIKDISEKILTGGTSFKDIEKIFNKEKIGYFITFTDGFAEMIDITSTKMKKFIWIIVNNTKFEDKNNNKVIHIEV